MDNVHILRNNLTVEYSYYEYKHTFTDIKTFFSARDTSFTRYPSPPRAVKAFSIEFQEEKGFKKLETSISVFSKRCVLFYKNEEKMGGSDRSIKNIPGE